MKITYTGSHTDLSAVQVQKLEDEFRKVGTLLDTKKGELAAHVILTRERHLHVVEVTVPYYDHVLIGTASDPDLFTAVHAAVSKLEAQAVRTKEKRRDTHRVPHAEGGLA